MNCATCTLFDILKYRGKPYELTPCSKCFMTRLTTKTNKHSMLYDTDGAIPLLLLPVEDPQDIEQNLAQLLSLDTINMIMLACLQNFLVTLSNVVLKLTNIAKTYPVLYQILHLKMQHPEMSYYLIGRSLNPPCSKQNVLYHLSHAVLLFPDLLKAILTDTRFSGGRYAIKTTALKVLRTAQVLRVRKSLYTLNDINRRKTLALLKKLFLKPFKLSNISVVD